ncbi:hypothetical protein O6H91_01G169700 [Diphasiastrum complanatum]|uniref:Uncharacterized protein n=3 Tax=Diphasiastrum complanatum TaxID=34168 RepID=A0ACC2EYX3_DIPCM|nr:hypothetical protein O6H91_01G169700 [Diphasiastrum complanatum]KAJ7571627.1 hypothetical protein O6H91_01G169700 [Diphasiastrum complanatum]
MTAPDSTNASNLSHESLQVDGLEPVIGIEPKEVPISPNHTYDDSLSDRSTTMDVTKPAEDIVLSHSDGLANTTLTNGAHTGVEIGWKVEHDMGSFSQDGEPHSEESGSSEDTKLEAKQSHQPSLALQPRHDNSIGGSAVGNSKSERTIGRSTTLPSKSLSRIDDKASEVTSRQLARSTTEKGKTQKNFESANMRVVAEEKIIAAEKISLRKKKKFLRNLGTVKKDGTVEVNLDEKAHLVPEILGPELTESLDDFCEAECKDRKSIPPLQIVMLIVGTRGDVQPFIAIGKHLQEYGHRVRLATHANFREFVMSSGLEFYPLGGDPKILAEYMVKNKGFLPSGPSEIATQRKQLKSIINSLLPACIEPDDETGVPFKAQAIIANPPAYGHVHVQEALGLPLHIFFTMPWTPTNEFPHPLARIKNPAGFKVSYQVVDSLIWLGIKSLINDFRKKKLKLRPVTYLSGAHGSITNQPTGYIWSPHLVPKPKDWGPRTDVVGFCFLNLASDYKPPEDLVNFLRGGKKPIYIGFGSLPVEDPQFMMDTIIKALDKTQQRGIIIKGWGLTGDVRDPPDFVYLLENCPHDWLFPRCAAVVHHGGAGTTAAGLKAACPTTIIPFFGDQPFWGERVHLRGVGPAPIPIEHFSLDKLVHAIEFMLDPQVKQKAVELAKCMEGEDGVVGAVNAFHKHLPLKLPECSALKTTRQIGFSQMMRKVWCSS